VLALISAPNAATEREDLDVATGSETLLDVMGIFGMPHDKTQRLKLEIKNIKYM